MKSLFAFLLIFATASFATGLHAQDEMTVAESSIGALVHENAETTTLAKALDAAGLTVALEGGEGMILMAPTDAAFAALPAGTLEALLLPENAEALTALLQYHLIDSADETSTAVLTEVLDSGDVTVGEQLEGGNGTVYLIDQVLVPADFDLEGLTGNN
ncbi:MAG: fasciclin domain-containing protein [Lewinella sp.]